MPKRSLSNCKPQVLLSRPQRNTKTKIVFDPSDNHLPKKKITQLTEKLSSDKKTASSLKKSIETSIAKKNLTNDIKNKSFVQSKNNRVNGFIKNDNDEYIDDNLVSTDIQDNFMEACDYCKNNIQTDKLIDCRICLRGVHRDCLLVEEPTWMYKLENCMFLCRSCRQKRCSKCTQGEDDLETLICCLTCKVGLHIKCYEECTLKPLYIIQPGSYLCTPCMTLATKRIPELEENEELPEYHCPSISATSDGAGNEDNTKSNESLGPSSFKSFNNNVNSSKSNRKKNDVPCIYGWNKERVFNYFSNHLPEEVAIKIIEEDLDGDTIMLFQRSHLPRLKMNLGKAMQFYKIVLILQAGSTEYSVLRQ